MNRLVSISLSFVFLLALVMAGGCSSPRVETIEAPTNPAFAERGKNLARGLAACGFCHGEKPQPDAPLTGGRPQYDAYGQVFAPNITPAKSGLGKWDTEQIIKAIRSAVNRRGDLMSQEVHRGYEWMSDDDLLSLVAYLRTVPAVENSVKRRSIDFIEKNTTGFFDKAPDIRGYIPAINPKFQVAYGQYLTDHVAKCGFCHNSPGDLVHSAVYLGGGKLVRNDSGEKMAPDITSSQTHGIGDWAEGDIVQYVMTGQTPDKRYIDPAFCPIGFYRNASAQDLLALAKYLKTVPASN